MIRAVWAVTMEMGMGMERLSLRMRNRADFRGSRASGRRECQLDLSESRDRIFHNDGVVVF